MRLYSFGGVVFPVDEGEHSMPIVARSSLITLVNGSYDQDGGTGYRKPVQLSARGWLSGASIDTNMDTLLSMVSHGRRILRAVMRDGTTYRQTFAKLLSVAREAKSSEWDYYQPVALTFEQDYPYWLASADEPVYLNDGYLLDGTWYYTAGHVESKAVNASPFTFTISNTGGVRVPRGYIMIVPRAAATMSAITIANAANGMSFTYGGSLTAADVLEVDLLTKSIEFNAAGDYDQLTLPANQSDWMILETGDNIITVTSTRSGTVDLYWQWSRHYL